MIRALLRRLRLSVWADVPKHTEHDPRPLWQRVRVFFGIRGRF